MYCFQPLEMHRLKLDFSRKKCLVEHAIFHLLRELMQAFYRASLIAVTVFLAGCGTNSSCKDYMLAVCDDCGVSDRMRDLTCSCLKDGEVRNPRSYDDQFNSAQEAKVWCANLRNSYDAKYLSEDQEAQCSGKLDVMKKYGSDSCEQYGFDPPSNGGSWGDDDDSGYDYDY